MQRTLPLKEPIEASGPDSADTSANSSRTALIVLRRTGTAGALVQELVGKGFSVRVEADGEKALEFCRDKPPDLVVVDGLLPGMSGTGFIAELVKIAWTSASILVIDKDETSVHEQTEGLGILGHIKSFDDRDSLDRLLEKYMNMAGH